MPDGSIEHGLRLVQPAFGKQQTSEFAQGKNSDSIGCSGFVDRLTKIFFSLLIVAGCGCPLAGNQKVYGRRVLAIRNLNEKESQNRTAQVTYRTSATFV
jgi:hypothetical protein